MHRALATVLACLFAAPCLADQDRPRARVVGVAPGMLPTGPLNAITDVPGVLVGQTTVIRGDSIPTGVIAILPHGGNLYQDRVPAAVFVINGVGQLGGTTQEAELSELETPILLTCMLCVWKATAGNGSGDYALAFSTNAAVRRPNWATTR
jgi:D-aminopeptidase